MVDYMISPGHRIFPVCSIVLLYYSVEDDNYLYLRIRKSNAVVSITSLLENGQTLCSHDTSEMISLAHQVLDKL